MIHDHEYNIGDELYFFDGRSGTFKRIKIINKNKDGNIDTYLLMDINGNKHWTHRFYLYETKDSVKEQIDMEIVSLRYLMSKLESEEMV
jgi:hypothetical protein